MPVLRDPLRTYARASRRQSAAPADLRGVFSVTGRGGTVLQPTVSFLHRQPNFPADAPLMNITDGWCEEKLLVVRDHCFVLPRKGWSEDAMPCEHRARSSCSVWLPRIGAGGFSCREPLTPARHYHVMLPQELDEANRKLTDATAEARIAFALECWKPNVVLSSSFGAQAAVLLHMVTRQWPDIPVVLLDTQYLFPETYKFADELTTRLGLNLKVYQSPISREWQEARHGKLWEMGADGIKQFNAINKTEPMARALSELNAEAWITGLRRSQSSTRIGLQTLAEQDGRVKVHPIYDWSNKDVHQYLTKYDLPYHPLWEQGYVSIGDVMTSRPLTEGMSEEDTRFFGLGRECGLHTAK